LARTLQTPAHEFGTKTSHKRVKEVGALRHDRAENEQDNRQCDIIADVQNHLEEVNDVENEKHMNAVQKIRIP